MSDEEKYYWQSIENAFVHTFDKLSTKAFEISDAHGFSEENFGLKVALIHSELSEALEGWRTGNGPSDHIPEFTAVEEEFADAVIRIMSNSAFNKFRLAEAVVAKMKFNEGRPYKHGGKVF